MSEDEFIGIRVKHVLDILLDKNTSAIAKVAKLIILIKMAMLEGEQTEEGEMVPIGLPEIINGFKENKEDVCAAMGEDEYIMNNIYVEKSLVEKLEKDNPHLYLKDATNREGENK